MVGAAHTDGGYRCSDAVILFFDPTDQPGHRAEATPEQREEAALRRAGLARKDKAVEFELGIRPNRNKAAILHPDLRGGSARSADGVALIDRFTLLQGVACSACRREGDLTHHKLRIARRRSQGGARLQHQHE